LSAYAGSILSVQPISFGNIVSDPSGDLIEINASAGAAAPRVYGDGRSYINGGNSGLIRIKSDTAGETITLFFPGSVSEAGGKAAHTVEGLATRSMAGPVIGDGTQTLDFHIGGLLCIEPGQTDGNFQFDITVTVQFDNP
jgi:hypothetical protein